MENYTNPTIPILTIIQQADGKGRSVIIEPVLKEDAVQRPRNTGSYKIFKDSFGDETKLFKEPTKIDDVLEDLDGNINPDYLGELRLLGDRWSYSGNLLSHDEQAQTVAAISSYTENI